MWGKQKYANLDGNMVVAVMVIKVCCKKKWKTKKRAWALATKGKSVIFCEWVCAFREKQKIYNNKQQDALCETTILEVKFGIPIFTCNFKQK